MGLCSVKSIKEDGLFDLIRAASAGSQKPASAVRVAEPERSPQKGEGGASAMCAAVAVVVFLMFPV